MTRPLSILDLTRLRAGETSSQALATTVEMARLADALGYERYWFAEHHSAHGLASGAPEVMIAHVAAQTERIRVGSGGVMLPNHAPLKIAEVFHLLEALHPGRIDLGLGRAPGTDQRTAFALRRSAEAMSADDYPERLAELLAYEDHTFPTGHLFETISITPDDVPLPPIWLLGSSAFSAQLSAQMGLGFSFASHINRPAAVAAMNAYREQFAPSSRFAAPHAILAASVVVGETIEAAQDLATIVRVGIYRLLTGNMGPSPSLEDARKVEIPAAAAMQVQSMLGNQIIGTPESVARELKAFADETRADEVMLTSWIPDRDNREFVLREVMGAWQAIDVEAPTPIVTP
ncbi:MAG TPA: LLM class flavin-dependent oxidoreductase [Thermomicrobiales bacterium]|jgi:luciferase family oxidoreductase group 1|nr:LLM class flavin-dependent oxidoreductase [Thermomicrobiales bacterium]